MTERFPAVRANGNVYVATRGALDHKTRRRMPVRHADALTKFIYVIAGTDNLDDASAQRLIKNIDMGRITCEYGSAFADGSDFEPIKP